VVRLTRLKRCSLLLYPALLGLGAITLASCVGEESRPPRAAALHPVPPPPETLGRLSTVPRPARKPTPPPPTDEADRATGGEAVAMTEPRSSEGTPASEPTSSAAEAAASANPAGALPSHVELIGLDQPAATRLFGPAAERSEEPPATVWRYKSGICELDLFFYLDLRSGRLRTLHYALKDGSNDAAQRQNCLRSLIASRGE
jgi:hypothetical protein